MKKQLFRTSGVNDKNEPPEDDEEEDTVTFHDALSDTTDDVLLEDLEYD